MITNIKDWKKVNEMISPYYTWEGQLIQLMEDAFEMTHSDASGILMANQDEYERYFYDGKTIQEVLEIIKAKVLSEKLDKPGKEDIDMNNDGKVDKSDFYLLNKRRKIKKAMKKNEQNNLNMSNYTMAMNIFVDFNTLTALLDEGYLNDDLSLKENILLESLNEFLTENDMVTYGSLETFNNFITMCKGMIASYENTVNKGI